MIAAHWDLDVAVAAAAKAESVVVKGMVAVAEGEEMVVEDVVVELVTVWSQGLWACKTFDSTGGATTFDHRC